MSTSIATTHSTLSSTSYGAVYITSISTTDYSGVENVGGNFTHLSWSHCSFEFEEFKTTGCYIANSYYLSIISAIVGLMSFFVCMLYVTAFCRYDERKVLVIESNEDIIWLIIIL